MSGSLKKAPPPPPPPRTGIPPPPPYPPPPSAGISKLHQASVNSNPLLNRLKAQAARTPVVQAASPARTPVVQSASPARTPVVQAPVTQLNPKIRDAEAQIRQAQRQMAEQQAALAKAAPKSLAGRNATGNIASLQDFIRQQEYIIIISRSIMEKGLNLIDINGNGNCYFLALSFALTNTFPYIERMQNNFIALFLRKLAVEGVVSDADQLHATTGWPEYADIYTEHESSRTPRFNALSLESKKLLYRKLMSKFNIWAGQYETRALMPYLQNYCLEVYTYGEHVRGQYSFDTTNRHNCDNRARPVLRIYHTGNHYDTVLTGEELHNFQQLPQQTEAQFTGRSDQDLINEFTQYLDRIKRATELNDIVSLERSINLIKIELNRRHSRELVNLIDLYNRSIKDLSNLFEAESSIPWETSADFAGWEAAEVAEKFSRVPEKANSAQRATALRTALALNSSSVAQAPSSAAQTPSSAAQTPAGKKSPAQIINTNSSNMQELLKQMEAVRLARATPEERAAAAAIDAEANKLLRATPERLLPMEFLSNIRVPRDVESLANEVYKGYRNNSDRIHQIIVSTLNKDIHFNEIIPRYAREGTNTMGGLIQSNYKFAADTPSLQAWKIKLIIQASNDTSVKSAIRAGLQTNPDPPLLLELDMADDQFQDIKTPLTKSLDYKGKRLPLLDLIEAVRNDGGSVLVNCAAGMSRSAAIILMYLMRPDGEKNMSFLNAWRFLKYKRPVVLPNPGFIRKLQDYERETRREDTVSEQLVKLHPALVPLALPVSQSVVPKIKGKCQLCNRQNPATAKQCEGCTLNLEGGRRKTRRNKAKLYKRKYSKKRR